MLHEAAKPTNQSVVRSFLGLAQCCFDFIDNFATMTVLLLSSSKRISHRKGAKVIKTISMSSNPRSQKSDNHILTQIKRLDLDASPISLAKVLMQKERLIVEDDH